MTLLSGNTMLRPWYGREAGLKQTPPIPSQLSLLLAELNLRVRRDFTPEVKPISLKCTFIRVTCYNLIKLWRIILN